MEMRVGGKVEGEKIPVETGPGTEQVGERNEPFARRRGPYTERQWYDERIGRAGRGGR